MPVLRELAMSNLERTNILGAAIVQQWDAEDQVWRDVAGPYCACSCRPFCGLPPCTACGEDHGGHDHGNGAHLCRDCDIEWVLASMECSVCKRMRYRTETPIGNFGAYLWGDPCACDPRPPSMLDLRRGAA